MYISGTGTEYERLEDIIPIIKDRLSKNNYLVVGCDSQKARRRKHTFVLSIALVDEGNGGIFFIKKWREDKTYALAEKLYKEAYLLIELANELKEYNIETDKIELHLDLSEDGRSGKFIKGVVGMCTAYGFDAKVKNEAWASSGLADRYSKH
jgi:predicted RNase H-related nuclease YkuK (DUF458 family)